MKRPSSKSPSPATTTDHAGALQILLQAIEDDDRRVADKCIKANPSITAALVERPKLYDSAILHWLYAGDSALHLGAAGHRVQIVEALLRAGADPNLAGKHRLARPLHYASDGVVQHASFDAAHQVKTMRCLLEAGAEIQAADKNGATALHRAVRTRCAKAVEFLLEIGADPLALNHSGSTAFHLAVQNTGRGGSGDPAARAAQQEIIQSMLTHGVRPTITDARGKSVLDWAKSEWIQELLTKQN